MVRHSLYLVVVNMVVVVVEEAAQPSSSKEFKLEIDAHVKGKGFDPKIMIFGKVPVYLITT